MNDTPKTFTADEIATAMAAQNRAFRRMEARAVEKEREAGERRQQIALDDLRREMMAGARANVERGVYTLSTLECDEYRHTNVVLAEVRTRVFAARLSFSDEDAAWTIEAIIRRYPGGPARVLEKEVLTQQAAWDFFNEVVERFYNTAGFICRVDY
ncbi:hypothetical protein D869_gp154 [Caulobacter phage CcrRogue]|uniref:Uncharacterized protein n=1 Tax=Caulobacter phage CcrRogue TaxID=2927986 RepID=K4JR41_9CAUD|nr:hypothetical protein D869_gp154 [Caulobacter phage CcrRogue]AFU86760.1 hypothetical protein CcrRogue_gp278 [Caulobacter phage CcrRogue]